MKRALTGLLVLVLTATSCQQVLTVSKDDIRISDSCLAWKTSIPAICSVKFCTNNMCYVTGFENDYSEIHCLSLPGPVSEVNILSKSRDGQFIETEVTP
mgnify:CR=1 FL=1